MLQYVTVDTSCQDGSYYLTSYSQCIDNQEDGVGKDDKIWSLGEKKKV